MKREDITGVVLAGGRGTRMGGIDKGLQLLNGKPLVLHALDRLTPQVGPLAINANRHAAEYAAFGVPVWPDPLPGQPGPLAGLLAAVQNADTPYVACVPCDSPAFPADLVPRLAAALQAEDAVAAVAITRDDLQPVFCLLKTTLRPALEAALHEGRHKVGQWLAEQRCARAVFDDPAAFFNANTLPELQSLETRT